MNIRSPSYRWGESQYHELKDQTDPGPNNSNDQEDSQSEEVDNDDDNGKVPIGSQYDLEQEGDPLNEYKEYVEVEDHSDKGIHGFQLYYILLGLL